MTSLLCRHLKAIHNSNPAIGVADTNTFKKYILDGEDNTKKLPECSDQVEQESDVPPNSLLRQKRR